MKFSSFVFQSTLPREERPKQPEYGQTANLFQSTLPREERLFPALLRSASVYFNPRSHERSDSLRLELITMLRISIHAPTRGATGSLNIQSLNASISIHAPTRGATNTRTVVIVVLDISIHAPTRGATITKLDSRLDNVISIHAPTRGATAHSQRVSVTRSKFQSTLPREERQY